MTKSRIALLAALFLTGVAAPAFADWDTIGTIEVGPRDNGRGPGPGRGFDNRGGDRDVKTFNLGGPVEKLQLQANRGDVNCRSVNATFNNAPSARLYSGPLRQDRPTTVDIPGRSREIRSLAFNCDTNDRRGAAIKIVADIGGYRDQWRRSPDWQRQWANVFNWGSNTVNNWQMIGSESFDGRNDSETSYAGRRGLRVDAIALKPLETDARCSRVVARFDNGKSQVLALHNGDLLRRGQYEKLDLPGDTSNLARLDLRCRAADARRVTIQIFTSK